MKFFVALACLVVVVYGMSPEVEQHFKDTVHKVGGECKTELGAADDDVAPMLNHEPPTTDKGKCVLACMHKKMGFQDKSGKIDKDGSLAAVEKLKPLDADLYGKMKQVAEACLAEVKDAANECETAVEMFVCVKKEKEAHGVPSIDLKS